MIARFVAAAESTSPAETEAALDAILTAGSFEAVVDDLLLPATAALGDAWTAGRLSVAAEHAASAAVARRLGAVYQAAGIPTPSVGRRRPAARSAPRARRARLRGRAPPPRRRRPLRRGRRDGRRAGSTRVARTHARAAVIGVVTADDREAAAGRRGGAAGPLGPDHRRRRRRRRAGAGARERRSSLLPERVVDAAGVIAAAIGRRDASRGAAERDGAVRPRVPGPAPRPAAPPRSRGAADRPPTGASPGFDRTVGVGDRGTAGRWSSAGSGWVASQTIVSAPAAGVRSSGRISRWKAGSDLGEARRVGPARVHRRERDAGLGEPARPLAHERHLGPLRAGVRARPGVRRGAELEVVEVESLRVHAARRDRDDPRTGGPPQERQEPRRPSRTGRPRGAPASPRCRPVRRRARGRSPRRCPPRRPGAPRVARIRAMASRTDASEPMSATTTGNRSSPWTAHEVVAKAAEPLLAAPHEDDPRPERGQRLGRRPTQPRGRAGHEGRPSGQRARGRRPAQPKSRRRTDGPMREKLPITEISRAGIDEGSDHGRQRPGEDLPGEERLRDQAEEHVRRARRTGSRASGRSSRTGGPC